MSSLSSRQKGTSPGPPGLKRPNRPLRSAASTPKLYSLRQSVPLVWVSPKLKAEALLEFLPFEVFPAHDLDPQPNLPRRQLLTWPQSQIRTQRTLRPSRPGEVFPSRRKKDFVGSLQPPSELARTGLHRLSFSLGLRKLGAPNPPTLGALKFVGSGVSPQRSPTPLSFVASSLTSWLRKRSGPGL